MKNANTTHAAPTGADLEAAYRSVTGGLHTEVALRIIDQASRAILLPRPKDLEATITSATSTLACFAPRDVLESFLSVQMIAVHESAAAFLGRSTREDQPPEVAESNVVCASRLMDVFRGQIEAMRQLKRRPTRKGSRAKS